MKAGRNANRRRAHDELESLDVGVERVWRWRPGRGQLDELHRTAVSDVRPAPIRAVGFSADDCSFFNRHFQSESDVSFRPVSIPNSRAVSPLSCQR